MRRVLVSAAFFALLAAVWFAVARAHVWPPMLLPSPGAVLRYLEDAFADGTMLHALGVTARRLAVGYLIGVVAGLPLGFVTARWKTCADTIGVLALGLQTLPSVCWVPLALLWFGQTETAMLFVVVMGTLWSIVIATDSGIRTVPPIYVRAARTMGSSGLHTLLCVVFPASLPVVISGMKQGWAFAWRSLMAAEVYVSIITGVGLGRLLDNGRELSAMDQVFGVMLMIVLVGLAVDKLLFAPAERFLRRRWGTEADV
jgi:NitT/TauT family transport system permease protein